ncbi:hypothetical protein N665_0506s0034, partial [Sinapis alba]
QEFERHGADLNDPLYSSKCLLTSPHIIHSILKKRPILVAASVGSYGAYLADGSEYSGIYGDLITLETLKDFHRRRLQVLGESGADIIAFETIPSKLEAAQVLIAFDLLDEGDVKISGWFSFNSKDGVNVVSGDSIKEYCIAIAEACEKVVAVGINCTSPRFIEGLVLEIAKPILVYPNSGERYDADRKEWVENAGVGDEDFVSYVEK